MIKKLVFFILLTISFQASFGQVRVDESKDHPVLDVSGNILKWMRELNSEIKNFSSIEKCDKMIHQLDYLHNDLGDYLVFRRLVMDTLQEHNYQYKFSRSTDFKLISMIRNLVDRMKTIDYEMDYPVREKMSGETYEIENVFNSQIEHFISQLDKIVAGYNVDVSKLKSNTISLYKRLTKAGDLITKIQQKLDAREKELKGESAS